MSLRMQLLGVTAAAMVAFPAFADDADAEDAAAADTGAVAGAAEGGEIAAELEAVWSEIDAHHTGWDSGKRTEVLSLYFRALTAHEEGDDEAAAAALAELKERLEE